MMRRRKQASRSRFARDSILLLALLVATLVLLRKDFHAEQGLIPASTHPLIYTTASYEKDMPEYGVSIGKINASSGSTQRSFLYGFIEKDTDSFQVRDVAIQALEPGLTALWINRTLQCCSEGGIVLDIGGHFGYYSLLSNAMGCSFIAFEPVSTFASVFYSNMLLNGVKGDSELIQAVLGKETGDINMIVPTSGVLGLARVEGNGSPLGPKDQLISVPALTLDELNLLPDFKRRGGKSSGVCAMKIDVEGYEPNVMKGGATFMKESQVPHVMLEFSPGYGQDGLEAMLKDFHELGYKAIEINWGLAKIAQRAGEVDVGKYSSVEFARDISSMEARTRLIDSVDCNTNLWFSL